MQWLGNRYTGRKALGCCLWLWLACAAWPAGGVEADAEVADPLWPLDLPTRYLTSNFMEYRSGRFHAGLDLKTQSKTGFAARAAEDGSIVRVRATSNAYGRAIYLLGESGRTYVYAHLSRFNDPIRALVRAEQTAGGTYRAQLHLAPGKLMVRRGDVLGLTGESGTNGPHLHFEVRDAVNGPVNPLAMGFAVPDTFAPVIHAVRAVPADVRSRIDGGPDARLVKPDRNRGLSGEQPPLRISGPVAFAAKIIDASDVRGHKLEPWLIEVKLDGEVVYSCRNDRYEFSENSLQRLEWLEVPGIRDRWLHRRAGNSLTGRQGDPWYLGADGVGLAAGPHKLEITASDFAGNTTSVQIPLLAAEMESAQSSNGGSWVVDPVIVVVDSLSSNNLRPLIDVTCDGVLVRRLDAGQGDPVLAPTTLATVAEELGEDQKKRARRQGLELVGPAARYLAADWPIDAAVLVELTGPVIAVADTLPPEKDPAVGVYRWSRGKWRPAAQIMAAEMEGAYQRFALSSPGLHAVFRDVAAPLVFPADTVIVVAADPRGKAHGVTLPRWEIFPVDLLDLGSGIAAGTISATLDGQAIIVEPDMPRSRILVELPDALGTGRHVLHLKAADGAENEAEAEVMIDCRE
ncbi:MAG: M23 family metallopeptidase [Candidatus Krumholzibacteriota bacterium]